MHLPCSQITTKLMHGSFFMLFSLKGHHTLYTPRRIHASNAGFQQISGVQNYHLFSQISLSQVSSYSQTIYTLTHCNFVLSSMVIQLHCVELAANSQLRIPVNQIQSQSVNFSGGVCPHTPLDKLMQMSVYLFPLIPVLPDPPLRSSNTYFSLDSKGLVSERFTVIKKRCMLFGATD